MRRIPQSLALLVLGAAVVTARGVAIADAHSERLDDPSVLHHGLAFLEGTFNRIEWVRSPPLAPALAALPVWVAGARARELDRVLYDGQIAPETALLLVAVWKSLLFLPLLALAFHWCRSLYGAPAAWLAATLLLVEPNFAAHIPLPTHDVLTVSAIALAMWLAWRYADNPGLGRLVWLCIGIAVAALMKFSAFLLPAVVVLLVSLVWRARGESRAPRWALGQLLAGLALSALALWALTGFDFAPIRNQAGEARAMAPWFATIAQWRVPARMFLAAVWDGIRQGDEGVPAFLLGMHSMRGWWYYFPVLATYKIPLGVFALFGLGIASLRRRRPVLAELGLVVPMAAWSLVLLTSPINIGFRHALPSYFFAILLAARAVAGAPRAVVAAAWLAVAGTAVHAATFHPDYLSYANFPREKLARDIGDSNLDWGQGLKQIARWLDARQLPAGRPVWLVYHPQRVDAVRHYVGGRARSLEVPEAWPSTGLLIISPMQETANPVVERRLRPLLPDAVIGHAVLVYDLDRLAAGGPFEWERLPPTEPRSP